MCFCNQTALEAIQKEERIYVPLEPIAIEMGYQLTVDDGKLVLKRQSGVDVLLINNQLISEAIYRTFLLINQSCFDAETHNEEENKRREQIIKEETLEDLKEWAVVKELGEKMGVTLSEEAQQEIQYGVIAMQGGYVNDTLMKQGFNANYIRDEEAVDKLCYPVIMALAEDYQPSKEALDLKKKEVAAYGEQMICKSYQVSTFQQTPHELEMTEYYINQLLKEAIKRKAIPYHKELSKFEEIALGIWYRANITEEGETKELQDEMIQKTITYDKTGDEVQSQNIYIKQNFSDEVIEKLKKAPLNESYPAVIQDVWGDYYVLQIESFIQLEAEEVQKGALIDLKYTYGRARLDEQIKLYSIVKLSVNGIVFSGDACNCFDGVKDEIENLPKARSYWENKKNKPQNGCGCQKNK